MGRREAREASASDIRGAVRRLHVAFTRLERERAGATDWLKLRCDVTRCYVEGQRMFVESQSSILEDLRSDRALRPAKRERAGDIFLALGSLHELARMIDQKLGT